MSIRDDELTAVERGARARFEASVEALDPRSRAQLAAARRAAVDVLRRPVRQAWRAWVPATALASAALVAVLLWRAQTAQAPAADELELAGVAAGDAALTPVELLAAGEDLDLVLDDLEFYDWLDATGFDTAGSAG